MKNTPKRDHNKLRVTLGIIVGVLGAFAIYMSWGALTELAIAYGIPWERALAFPLIIDLPAIAAMLIASTMTDSTKYKRFLPWAVFGIFGLATIAGNAEVVSRTPAGEYPGPVWIAVLVHSAPAIAALFTAHLAVETVYRKDRWTDRVSKTTPSPARSTVSETTTETAESREASTETANEKRTRVETLTDEGNTPAEIVLLTGYPKSSVYKWAAARAKKSARVSA